MKQLFKNPKKSRKYNKFRFNKILKKVEIKYNLD